MERERNNSFIKKLKEISPVKIIGFAFLGELATTVVLGPGGIIPGFLIGGILGFRSEWRNKKTKLFAS